MLDNILSLSLEQKIGQLFFIGIPGIELDQSTKELIEIISPGGICLFARNVRSAEQVNNLLQQLTDILPIKPLLSLDQEGGTVDRLRRISTPMPSAKSLRNVDDAENLANITGKLIRMLGFNMNFAPVVDVLDEHRKKFSNGLQSRAFGNSADNVVKFAGAYLDKLQKNDIIGCLKHFPGLGASEVDSHEELPLVKLDRNELFENDLKPYIELLKTSQVNAVMVAHASFPKFDLQETDSNGKLLPSSLSYNVVTKLLREELGFNGLAITDDLEMGAILTNYGIGTACRMAISAGEDMLAICAKPDSVKMGFDALLSAVKNGIISESRIDQSLKRIALVKSLIPNPIKFDFDEFQKLSEETARLNKELDYNYGG